MTEDGTVFVGFKPLMNYVTEVQALLMSNGSAQVCLRSRGKFTSKAIDVAEVLKRLGGVAVKAMSTGSATFKGEGGKAIRVSTVEIVLGKNVQEVKG